MIIAAKEQCQWMIDQDQSHQSLHVIEMNVENDLVAEKGRKLLMEKTGLDYR